MPSSAGQITCCFSVVWEGMTEGASCFPEYSCSLCSTFTSCLGFLPILPAWPISIHLKHDWQNTDNYRTPHRPISFYVCYWLNWWTEQLTSFQGASATMTFMSPVPSQLIAHKSIVFHFFPSYYLLPSLPSLRHLLTHFPHCPVRCGAAVSSLCFPAWLGPART